MAVSHEVMSRHRVDYLPQRLSSNSSEALIRPFPEGSFLDTLDPLYPRQSRLSLPPTIDISILMPSMLEVIDIAQNPLRRKELKEVGKEQVPISSVIFSAQQTERGNEIHGKGTVVEAGVNSFLDPLDERIYSAKPVWGTPQKLDTLYDNLIALSEDGKYPIHTQHSHPEPFIPFPSIDDMLIFLMQRRRGEDIPLVNAMTILGSGIQVTGMRTAESPELMTDFEVKEIGEEWNERYRVAGNRAKKEWNRASQRLHGARNPKSDEEYTQFIQSAKDTVVVSVSEELGIQFYVSNDMRNANAMPTEEVIHSLRTKN